MNIETPRESPEWACYIARTDVGGREIILRIGNERFIVTGFAGSVKQTHERLCAALKAFDPMRRCER